MKLSKETSDLKLYSRSKFFDGLPYTSNDIHNKDDLLYRKLGLILNSMVGSGILEQPVFNIEPTTDGFKVRLSNPFPINLNGDIFLVGNSQGVYPVDIPGDYVGSIILVCWVKELSSSSTLYEYGGLCNNTLENDIIDEELGVQVSTRFQIRWNICPSRATFDYNNISIKDIPISGGFVSENGEISNITLQGSSMEILGNIIKCPANDSIPSDDGYIYILPICSINSGRVVPVSCPKVLSFVTSSTEPATSFEKIWYNPLENKFKIVVNNKWVNLGEDLYEEFRYLGEYTFSSSYTSSSIDVPIPTEDALNSTDKLKILYSGIELVNDHDYTINYNDKKITLTNFTANVGDIVTFLVSSKI